MAHKSLYRMIRCGPLKISKSLKNAENDPFGKNIFPITAAFPIYIQNFYQTFGLAQFLSSSDQSHFHQMCPRDQRSFRITAHRYPYSKTFLSVPKFFTPWPWPPNLKYFLCRLRSIAAHRNHFVRHLSVCLSVCWSGSHTFLVVTHSYVSQATHAFLGMLPLC